MMVKKPVGLKLIRRDRGMIAKIAKGLGIAQPSVSQWTRIPAERVVDIERITGIQRERLRPDLYRKKRHHNTKNTTA